MSFVTFGEIMLRLSPGNHLEKLVSSNTFSVNYAGSASNVASSLALLGTPVCFVTKLPKNSLGDAAVHALRSYGIITDHILRDGDRIGIYFIEMGTSIRPSRVIYDRRSSALSTISEGAFNWEGILAGHQWLHLSGITPALSDSCAVETIRAAKTARKLGVKVSFDMNYRRSLWNDAKDARKIFDQIIACTDVLFGNLGVLKDVYDMNFEGIDEVDKTMKAIYESKRIFGTNQLAFTVREHLSASVNRLSGIALVDTEHVASKVYHVEIQDRFGTGDAFAAGFLQGVYKGWNALKTIEFASAAFALKHTIKGDQHTSNMQEIQAIMEGHTSGHVLR